MQADHEVTVQGSQYMSPEEIESILRLQWKSLQGQSPYHEDYYFQVCIGLIQQPSMSPACCHCEFGMIHQSILRLQWKSLQGQSSYHEDYYFQVGDDLAQEPSVNTATHVISSKPQLSFMQTMCVGACSNTAESDSSVVLCRLTWTRTWAAACLLQQSCAALRLPSVQLQTLRCLLELRASAGSFATG